MTPARFTLKEIGEAWDETMIPTYPAWTESFTAIKFYGTLIKKLARRRAAKKKPTRKVRGLRKEIAAIAKELNDFE